MLRALLLPCFLPLAASAASFSPSPWLNYDISAGALTKHCAAAINRTEAGLKALAAMPAASRDFNNTPRALEQILWGLSDETGSDSFLKEVSVSSAVRQASSDCKTRLEKFNVDVFTREDIYAAIKSYAEKNEPLAGEDKKLLDKELLDFRRNGLRVPTEKRAEIKKLNQQIVELEEKFKQNLGESKDFLLATREELEGLPEDYINGLEKEDGRFRVSVDYPDFFPFMNNAKNPGARRRLEALFNNRAEKDNLPLLLETLRLRREAARLLGYKSFAEFALEEHVAKTPQAVQVFLDNLIKKLKPLAQKELETLRELKKQELGEKSDGIIHAWDWRYYDNQLVKTRYRVDKEQIKEYFPLEVVVDGMFAVYQKLLGLKFRELPAAAAWHPDVRFYEITDAAGKELIAYFYMDLFPREGKFKHAAAFDLIKGRRLADGSYQKPVCAIVANFNKPAPGRPSLLRHGEHEDVEVLFHEFGHIMHQTLTKATYGRFSGYSVAEDFAEAPSQMFENWVWNPEIIGMLSGHYKDHSKKLPPELLEKLIAAQKVDVGLKYLRQFFFASVDMAYHSPSKIKDTTALWAKLRQKISLIPTSPNTHPETSFDHIMSEYAAGYYGYLWSKVYAEDMYGRFESEGLLNAVLGRRYRETILEPGSGREELDLLRDFLGREPNDQAFLKSIGLQTSNNNPAHSGGK